MPEPAKRKKCHKILRTSSLVSVRDLTARLPVRFLTISDIVFRGSVRGGGGGGGGSPWTGPSVGVVHGPGISVFGSPIVRVSCLWLLS